MRASRLLSVLLTLSVRGPVSARALAAELEVSVRTIYRDVEALGAAGVPVYTTRGRGGGIHLLEGYRTRLTGMTPDEAAALLLGGVPGAAGDLGLGPVLATSQLKLLASLPPELRERAERIRNRFLLDAPGWERESAPPAALAAVAGAAWAQQRLAVRYEKSDRSIVERTLEPLGLVLKAGTWYLVAAVPDDPRGPRTYRVSRILGVATLADVDRPEVFDRPEGFDLEGFWRDYQRAYHRGLYRHTARIALDPTGRELLFLVGTVPARRARAVMSTPDDAGWATTELPIESVTHALHALLQLGEHVEVLTPPELRTRVAASARALAARYAEQ